jgi:sulfite reductase alpha subunit-like flavoprotein
MAPEWDGLVGDDVRGGCALRCWLRHSDEDSAPEQVTWAGLPVNLDFAFSREQRDKVYVQHLMRTRGARLVRSSRNIAKLCVCDAGAGYGHLDPGATSAMSEYMSSR